MSVANGQTKARCGSFCDFQVVADASESLRSVWFHDSDNV